MSESTVAAMNISAATTVPTSSTTTLSAELIYTGFPAVQPKHLLTETSKDPSGAATEVEGFCADLQAVYRAVLLTDTLLSGYMDEDEDAEADMSLDKYNLYVCIVASIVYTLQESNDSSAYDHLRSVPKYVTETQFIAYLQTTYSTRYHMSGINIQHKNGIIKGVEICIKRALSMYARYVTHADPHETIYTKLNEHRYPVNRDVNSVRIYPFPTIDDYVRFISGDYDVDVLLLPTKYRNALYERDAIIESLRRDIEALRTRPQAEDAIEDSGDDNLEVNNHEVTDVNPENVDQTSQNDSDECGNTEDNESAEMKSDGSTHVTFDEDVI